MLAIGSRVHHPGRGAGTIKAILADGRRVISFDSSAASRRYSVHALHKLTSGETRAIQARMLQIDWLRKVSPQATTPAKAATDAKGSSAPSVRPSAHSELSEGDVVPVNPNPRR